MRNANAILLRNTIDQLQEGSHSYSYQKCEQQKIITLSLYILLKHTSINQVIFLSELYNHCFQ